MLTVWLKSSIFFVYFIRQPPKKVLSKSFTKIVIFAKFLYFWEFLCCIFNGLFFGIQRFINVTYSYILAFYVPHNILIYCLINVLIYKWRCTERLSNWPWSHRREVAKLEFEPKQFWLQSLPLNNYTLLLLIVMGRIFQHEWICTIYSSLPESTLSDIDVVFPCISLRFWPGSSESRAEVKAYYFAMQ